MSYKINQALLTSYPNFAELYEQLTTEYLAPDGTTKELAKEIDQEEFIKERTEYLENITLHNALQQLTLHNDLKNYKEHKKILEILDELLSFAESKQYLNFHPSLEKNNYIFDTVEKAEIENVTKSLLGLTGEELIKRVENELDCLNDSKEFILNSIESKLTKQCEDIAKFYYPGEEANPKLLAAKASQLDKVLNRKNEELRMSKINIVENQLRLGERITTYLKVMKEILTNLWNLIEEFKFRHELEKNTTFNEFFSEIVKSLLLKLKVIRLQALTNVYDKKTVESLNVIRTNLIEEEKEKSTKLERLNNELMEYQSIGDEFEQIVQVYLDIIKQIETTEDDIRRIKEE
ncbi:HAUS augmin-like complex subunit 4-domain-containing protein [Glomus cerebriforme]|uniref:HAUS augmin-like complex subunit 4-domain-containing protein n=1 Tax=Glomus cerebriforme TaxID=658196 RepID=A0A397TK71_9GLOM|nr:HAUS augmin-like complex subunit 4-domain-containing protein [Glomus cerebriforme]